MFLNSGIWKYKQYNSDRLTFSMLRNALPVANPGWRSNDKIPEEELSC